MKNAWLLLPALLALSACEEEAADPLAGETGGEAAGEILGGTISDDMIPLEELTSTSPPAERTSAPRGTPAQTQEAEPSEESPASE